MAQAPAQAPAGDKFLVVDCSLPGQVRRLGRRMTFITPRRATRTSASDCEIRGGEYVSYDRADYRTALQVWLPQAEGGDPQAQAFVGEIYEKGRGGAIDYAAAASWYAKAADHGYKPAMVNLAHLYDEGLGVPSDKVRAGALLAQAANLPAALAPAVKFERTPVEDPRIAALSAQNAALTQQVSAHRSEVERLSAQLAQERDRLAAERADLARETDALNARLASSIPQAQDRDRLAAERARLARETEELKARLAASTSQAQDRDRLAAERARLARETEELKARLAASASQAQSQASATSAASAQVRAQAAELARRESALREREAAMRSEQGRLDALKSQFAAAQGAGPTLDLIEPHLVALRGDADFPVPTPARTHAIVGRAISTEGVLAVTVNGEKQALNASGVFNTNVDLMPQSTPVEIVAIDQRGRRTTTVVTFTRIPAKAAEVAQAVVGQPAIPAFDPSRIPVGVQHALLIGNSKYVNLPHLATPRADVDAIAEVLRTRYGFQTTVLYDATRYQILSKLNDLRASLTEKDDLLIYYAGHGQMVSMDNRSRGYWLPVDAEQNNTANWLSTPDITDAVATMNVHKVLLVSDSCYSGLLTRGLARLISNASPSVRESFLEAMAKPKSRNVLTSGGNTPVMDGGGGQHSVFAGAFLKVLAENDQPILGQDLATSVQKQVSYVAKAQEFDQLPQYGPLQLAGHESGDYVFIPRGPSGTSGKSALIEFGGPSSPTAALRR